MGCASSSPEAEVLKNQDSSSTDIAAKNGPAATTKESAAPAKTLEKASSFNADHNKPIETPTTLSVIGGESDGSIALKLRYACVSQRGRDPDDATKANQDCYSVHVPPPAQDAPNATGDPAAASAPPDPGSWAGGGAFFGVYDGHGPQGHHCSRFVRRRLPALIERNIQFDGDQVGCALREAHTECNLELRASEVQDAHSGTTAISVYVHGDDGGDEGGHKITVCNVGDSRAVLGTTDGGGFKWQAVPLSNDQTPKRADEAARCVAAGARILSFGQIDPAKYGDDDDGVEDPLRVWSKRGMYPGTAFTRSLGDAVAERLGVHAEPEQLTLRLEGSVKALVLASDGVFDVLDNQAVVDACWRCYRAQDPLGACRAIVAQSQAEWLTNDDCGEEPGEASYDDITVTCIFIGDSQGGTAEAVAAAAEGSTAPLTASFNRPKRVRQKTLQNLGALALGDSGRELAEIQGAGQTSATKITAQSGGTDGERIT